MCSPGGHQVVGKFTSAERAGESSKKQGKGWDPPAATISWGRRQPNGRKNGRGTSTPTKGRRWRKLQEERGVGGTEQPLGLGVPQGGAELNTMRTLGREKLRELLYCFKAGKKRRQVR